MAAKDALNKDLFHGTGGEIKGGVVKPGHRNERGYGAYGARNIHTARFFAGLQAYDEGRLFGTVYKVKPISENPKVIPMSESDDWVVDPKGLKVEEAVDYPINLEALHKTSRWSD